VVVSAQLGQEDLARGVVAAYDRGAHQVQVEYADPIVGRIRLERAAGDALGGVMQWVKRRPGMLAEVQAACLGISGPVAPGLLDDLDPGRIGRAIVTLIEWGGGDRPGPDRVDDHPGPTSPPLVASHKAADLRGPRLSACFVCPPPLSIAPPWRLVGRDASGDWIRGQAPGALGSSRVALIPGAVAAGSCH
jgi:hypothetical protein